MKISSFKGEHQFLSNFWMEEIVVVGEVFPSAEHAYQYLKAMDVKDKLKIKRAATPGKAKRLGRRAETIRDWGKLRLEIMEYVVGKKFLYNKGLKEKLLRTGSVELVEGNNWKDTFWGVCDGVGENHLGKILMKVRAEARLLK